MSWISDLRKIELPNILISVIVFLGTIAPGFLILYRFKPDLIEKLDIAKLLIFSASLTLPVLVVNVLGVLIIFLDSAEGSTEHLTFILSGTVISILSFYLAISGAYERSLSFLSFLWLLLEVDLVLLGLLGLFRFVWVRAERRTSPPERQG